MKTESTKVLQDLAANCPVMSINEIRKAIDRVFFIETPQTVGKFKLEKVCTKQDRNRDWHRWTDGIVYQNGWKFATDGFELYAIKEENDAPLRVIRPDGVDITNKFKSVTDLRQIVPSQDQLKDKEEYREFSVNLERAVNFQKEMKAAYKAAQNVPIDDPAYLAGSLDECTVKHGDCLYKLDRYINFLKFCEAYGYKTFMGSKRRAALAGNLDKQALGLLMPITKPMAGKTLNMDA